MEPQASYYVPYVIEKTGRGERTYDIYSRLLEDRIVFIGTEINDVVANSVMAQLLFLDRTNKNQDINVYINSPGGSVTAGMGIIDTMCFVPSNVATYIIGQAASMGSLIACSGTAGKRYALPNARNLMHQPLLSGVMEGQATDLEIEAREMIRLRDVLYGIYADRTGQTREKVAEDCERNKWLDAKQMVEYGLADTMLENLPAKS